MTLLETYISKPAFKNHVKKVISLYDPKRRFIDDIVQDFYVYYACRPDKVPNIRKLYNLMIDKLKHENRCVMVDFNGFVLNIDQIFDDNFIDL